MTLGVGGRAGVGRSGGFDVGQRRMALTLTGGRAVALRGRGEEEQFGQHGLL